MLGSKIHDTDSTQTILYGDSDIGELKNKADGTVTEEDLKTVLKRYNLRDGLITLGKASNFVLNAKGEGAIGRAAFRDPKTGAFITQFGLAYLANALITSGANDYKKKLIGNQQNLLLLSNIYSNSLVFPEIKRDDTIPFTKKDLTSLMVRMYAEQFEYQFNSVLLIARTIVIFTEIANKVAPKKFESFETVFENETTLTFEEYFYLSMAVWACAQQTATFRKESLTGAQIASMQTVLTDEKVTSFLKILSTDYNGFRAEDQKANAILDPLFTKFRFNPLLVYPIIKADRPEIDPYIIPNTLAFVKKAFGGLYWWFHRHFEASGNQLDFRNYYGELFEQYVGQVLKQMYGEVNVHPEIPYKNGKFIDWYVEKDDKVYLFEVKAKQFSLTVLQTGNIELIHKEVKEKLLKAVKQVYERISEIDSYQELKQFKGKKIIPIIVFLDIPLVSSGVYKKIIYKDLVALETEARYRGISQFDYHFLNVEELEDFVYVSEITPIEDIFETIKVDQSKGFTSEVFRLIGNKKNKKNLIDRKFAEFGKEFGVGEN